MTRNDLWRCVFISSLNGAAPYAKNKADCDELIARAKMLADKAAAVVAAERSERLPEDEEPFPLVRASVRPSHPSSGSFHRVPVAIDEVLR